MAREKCDHMNKKSEFQDYRASSVKFNSYLVFSFPRPTRFLLRIPLTQCTEQHQVLHSQARWDPVGQNDKHCVYYPRIHRGYFKEMARMIFNHMLSSIRKRTRGFSDSLQPVNKKHTNTFIVIEIHFLRFYVIKNECDCHNFTSKRKTSIPELILKISGVICRTHRYHSLVYCPR